LHTRRGLLRSLRAGAPLMLVASSSLGAWLWSAECNDRENDRAIRTFTTMVSVLFFLVAPADAQPSGEMPGMGGMMCRARCTAQQAP